MPIQTSLIAVLVSSAVLVGECNSAHAVSSARTRSLSKLMRDGTADTIRALDTDGNGRVSLTEIEAFAKKNGIAIEEIRADFSDLDKNRDGELDSQEIRDLFPASPGNDAAADAKAMAPIAADSTDAVNSHPIAVSEEASLVGVAPLKLTEASQISLVSGGETLKLEDIVRDAQHQAGGVLAEGLARRAEQLMQSGATDEQSAVSFETKARSLRGRSAAATRSIAAEAKQAAKLAAAAAAKEGLEKAKTLKHQAEKLEKDAAEHRSRATVALHQALQAENGLSSASSQLLKTHV